MNALQKRALAKKIYQEIQDILDKWNGCDFIKIHWNGDISVDGEYFEKWRLEELEEEL